MGGKDHFQFPSNELCKEIHDASPGATINARWLAASDWSALNIQTSPSNLKLQTSFSRPINSYFLRSEQLQFPPQNPNPNKCGPWRHQSFSPLQAKSQPVPAQIKSSGEAFPSSTICLSTREAKRLLKKKKCLMSKQRNVHKNQRRRCTCCLNPTPTVSQPPWLERQLNKCVNAMLVC